MKKIIALFLALLMAFSIATVALAEGEGSGTDNQTQDVQTPEGGDNTQNQGAETQNTENQNTENQNTEETTTTAASDTLNTVIDTVMNMPSGSAMALLKVGKIVLKFVKVFVKLGMKVGLIDTESIVNSVAEMFGLDPETELPAGNAQAINTLI